MGNPDHENIITRNNNTRKFYTTKIPKLRYLELSQGLGIKNVRLSLPPSPHFKMALLLRCAHISRSHSAIKWQHCSSFAGTELIEDQDRNCACGKPGNKATVPITCNLTRTHESLARRVRVTSFGCLSRRGSHRTITN